MDAALEAVEAAPIALAPVAVVPVKPDEQPATASARKEPIAITAIRIVLPFTIQATKVPGSVLTNRNPASCSDYKIAWMIADTARCVTQVYLPIALANYFLVQFSTAGFSRYSEIRNGFIEIKVNEEMSRSAIYRK